MDFEFILVFCLSGALSVTIHEIGHAFVQRSFKLPIKEIVIGRGPRLFKWRALEFRLFPFSGYVAPAGALMADRRWKGVLIAMAGLLAQWAAVIVIYCLGLVHYEWSSLFVIWFLFWAIFALIELVPIGRKDGKLALLVLLQHSSMNPEEGKERMPRG